MEPSDGPQRAASGGRHRAPEGPRAPQPPGGAHRAPAPVPPAPVPPARVPEPTQAADAGQRVVDERAADLARFLAAARERSTAAPVPARERAAPAARRWLRHVGLIAVAAVAVVGLAAAVHGLGVGAGSPPLPSVAGSGASPPAGSADLPSAPTASTAGPPAGAGATPTPNPTPTPTPTPTRRPIPTSPAGPPASSPPVKVREVPVVPVPATANGAGWQHVVGQLFATRSAAFGTGRPALLTAADAPGSALLRADQRLYAAAIERAGFTRAEGLGFDLDQVRLLSAASTTARLAVVGRERSYVLRGPAGERAVPAGPRRELTLQLSRSSTGSRWLLAAGSIRSGG